MIGFMPAIYPDELVYSWFARYYAHSGHSAYVFAIEDLLGRKNARPDVEFINRMDPAAGEVIARMVPVEDLILGHTMFPSMRFAPNFRKNAALRAMARQEGDARNLLPLPKSDLPRFLKYCPACAAGDRERFGEAFWRRAAQIKGADVCARHGCRLKATGIRITGKNSPRLHVAEAEIGDLEPEFVGDGPELELARYMTEVFHSPVGFGNEAEIGEFLNYRLEGTPYLSARGKMRNMELLFRDFQEFCKGLPLQGIVKPGQMQKIFTGYRWDFYEICQMAFFLNIDAADLADPKLPEKSQTERFNERVGELHARGLGCRRIAEEMGCSPSTARNANRVKPKAEHDRSVRKGMRRADWEAMDDEMLGTVRETCEQIYRNNGGRPGRVTAYAVCRKLGFPDKRLNYLPKCRAVIGEYAETYGVYWAREVAWAYGFFTGSENQKDICWRDVRVLTNLRKDNFKASFPYLHLFADKETEERIKNLIC